MKAPKVPSNQVCELVATYRQGSEYKPSKISASHDAHDFMRPSWPCEMNVREACVAMYLNRNNRILNWSLISIGGTSGTLVDSKIIFSGALMYGASSIIMMHNHPSGENKASQADLGLTRKLISAAKLLDMIILDHLIIFPDGTYRSMSDHGDVNFSQ